MNARATQGVITRETEQFESTNEDIFLQAIHACKHNTHKTRVASSTCALQLKKPYDVTRPYDITQGT